MQHSEKSNAVDILWNILQHAAHCGGKKLFEVRHIKEPESVLEEGDHERGSDDGPSQTATVWLTRTHI